MLNLEFGNIEAYGLAILGLPMLILWAGVFIAMSITYIIARLINNAGLVDVFWGFSFGLIVTFFLWLAPEPSEVQIIFTGMVILASLRLGGHIGQRFIHEHPKEDPRYTAFREHYHKNPEWMTFWVFQFQGVLMTIVSLPFWLIMLGPKDLTLLHWTAMGLYLIAWIGEGVADYQLNQFKRNPANKGLTCKKGLWNYSRHPNYFFQWMLWVSYAVYTLPLVFQGSPIGLLAWISPALMLHFLINITGVKATEEHSLTSRQGYAEYQRTTSMFIPWFKTTTQHEATS